jgi:hypothetical protein
MLKTEAFVKITWRTLEKRGRHSPEGINSLYTTAPISVTWLIQATVASTPSYRLWILFSLVLVAWSAQNEQHKKPGSSTIFWRSDGPKFRRLFYPGCRSRTCRAWKSYNRSSQSVPTAIWERSLSHYVLLDECCHWHMEPLRFPLRRAYCVCCGEHVLVSWRMHTFLPDWGVHIASAVASMCWCHEECTHIPQTGVCILRLLRSACAGVMKNTHISPRLGCAYCVCCGERVLVSWRMHTFPREWGVHIASAVASMCWCHEEYTHFPETGGVRNASAAASTCWCHEECTHFLQNGMCCWRHNCSVTSELVIRSSKWLLVLLSSVFSPVFGSRGDPWSYLLRGKRGRGVKLTTHLH